MFFLLNYVFDVHVAAWEGTMYTSPERQLAANVATDWEITCEDLHQAVRR